MKLLKRLSFALSLTFLPSVILATEDVVRVRIPTLKHFNQVPENRLGASPKFLASECALELLGPKEKRTSARGQTTSEVRTFKLRQGADGIEVVTTYPVVFETRRSNSSGWFVDGDPTAGSSALAREIIFAVREGRRNYSPEDLKHLDALYEAMKENAQLEMIMFDFAYNSEDSGLFGGAYNVLISPIDPKKAIVRWNGNMPESWRTFSEEEPPFIVIADVERTN